MTTKIYIQANKKSSFLATSINRFYQLKLLCFTLLMIWANYCQAQLEVEWSSIFDHGQILNYQPGMKVDAGGDVIVIGTDDIIKYDAFGNLLWTTQVEGYLTDDEGASTQDNLALDEQNNIYVTANVVVYTNGMDTLITAVQTSKYSPQGVQIWTSEYQYTEDYPQDGSNAIMLNDNKVFVTGVSIDWINYGEQFLVCYDADTGLEQWRRSNGDYNPAPGPDYDRGIRLSADSNGDIIVGGRSTANPNNEFYIWKYNTSGDLLWTSTYLHVVNNVCLLTTLVVSSDNNIITSGFNYSTAAFSSDGTPSWDFTPISTSPSNSSGDRVREMILMENDDVILTGSDSDLGVSGADYDILTMRVSSAGEIIWQARSGNTPTTDSDFAFSLTQDEEGNIFVVGIRYQDQGSGSNKNFLIIKYDGQTGEQLWEFIDNQDPVNDDTPYSIHVDADGALYVSGAIASEDINVFVTKKYNQVPVSTDQINVWQEGISLMPNPTNDLSFRVNSKNPIDQGVELSVFNSIGEMVYRIKDYHVGNAIRLNELPKGLYFVQLNIEDNLVSKKLILSH